MVTLDDLKEAQQRLRGVAVRTPLLPFAQANSDRLLYFKPENFQPIGAFKVRGAYNKIAGLTAEERARGVVAYSSGNHAQGVAYAAHALGVHATIVMPADSPKVKLEGTQAWGAEIVLVSNSSEERRIKAEQIAAERHCVIVPPYNDEAIIAGQGTVGLEILEDLPEVETVLVPVGGGGLLSGIAAALKLSKPNLKVIGVEPELASDAAQTFRKGEIVSLTSEQTTRTIADGLRTQSMGDLTFAHMQEFVDDVITVSEAEIRQATRQMALQAHLVAEPSGAVTFAAFLFHQAQLPATRLNVAIISGGNIEPQMLAEILTEA